MQLKETLTPLVKQSKDIKEPKTWKYILSKPSNCITKFSGGQLVTLEVITPDFCMWVHGNSFLRVYLIFWIMSLWMWGSLIIPFMRFFLDFVGFIFCIIGSFLPFYLLLILIYLIIQISFPPPWILNNKSDFGFWVSSPDGITLNPSFLIEDYDLWNLLGGFFFFFFPLPGWHFLLPNIGPSNFILERKYYHKSASFCWASSLGED